MKKILTIIATLALLTACATSAERAEREARVAQAVEQALAERHYKVDVQLMLPLRGKAMNVTSEYSLEVNGDTLISYLPYFGRVYNVPYGGGKGLNFTAPILRYEIQKDRKGRAQILLVTDNKENVVTYRLEIFSNGQATINVLSRDMEQINFRGELEVETAARAL